MTVETVAEPGGSSHDIRILRPAGGPAATACPASTPVQADTQAAALPVVLDQQGGLGLGTAEADVAHLDELPPVRALRDRRRGGEHPAHIRRADLGGPHQIAAVPAVRTAPPAADHHRDRFERRHPPDPGRRRAGSTDRPLRRGDLELHCDRLRWSQSQLLPSPPRWAPSSAHPPAAGAPGRPTALWPRCDRACEQRQLILPGCPPMTITTRIPNARPPPGRTRRAGMAATAIATGSRDPPVRR